MMMMRVLFSVVLFFATTTLFTNGNSVESEQEGSIESFNPNGCSHQSRVDELVKKGELPFQVHIFDNRHEHRAVHCSGVILNEHWILTSAKCVHPRNTYTILAGAVNITDPSGNDTMRIEKHHKVLHPDFEWRSTFNKDNIALIKLWYPLKWAKYIQPVQLAPKGFVSKKIQISSWISRYSCGGRESKELLKTQLDKVTLDYCKEAYNKKGFQVHDSNMCAIETQGKKSACCYVGGAPFYDVEKKLLVGVLSGSTCNPVEPAVGQDITEYLQWINSTISKE